MSSQTLARTENIYIYLWVRHHHNPSKLFTAGESYHLSVSSFPGLCIHESPWYKMSENKSENVQLHNKNSLGGSLVGIPYASLESIPLTELLSLKTVLSFVSAVLYGFHCLPLQHDLCQKV